MDIYTLVGYLCYASLTFVALLGGFFCVLVWRRVAQKRFKHEMAQSDFLDELEASLAKADFEEAAMLCDGDLRAVPQLAHLAILNRGIGFAKVRLLVEDRFQRDILAQLEYQMTWVHTVIKSAPMLGLFGTVTGMNRRERRTFPIGGEHQRRADYDGRWFGDCDSFDRCGGGHQHPH
ncbi:MAG: MotA/TolQ/ExbB proton channel family protein [Planctomycetia bacterium]|nr:MotA/TolQ/ExbB proton channel family protein [Planctomycetia bacterium]